ncbi:BapA/Bap/LapF family prefix-like domain-containing protein [Acinetobacter pseudolwoffii]|uniref:BapA/Bap/LapF family prefix-like domain-containing protein n=1 Tax=Acinetobacter pseudolwoffii TaxID=2053287 RepID=UPI003989D554
MKNITLIDKSSHNITSQFDSNKIINLTSKPTVIVLKHEIEIFEIKQENNQVVIILKNGEKIIVEGFFDADHSLVVQGSDQQLIWVQFTDQRGALLAEINYQPLEEIEPLLYKDGAVLPWLWPVVTAGGILAWAADGSSKDSKKTDSVPPDNGNGENNTGGDNNTGGAGGDLINGKDGLTPYIGENGNWFIGETDTGIKAEGEAGQDGLTPHIGANGNWFIGETDTGIKAQGDAGSNGTDGKSAYDLAVENGYTGTLEEWLAALKGEAGANGQSAYELAVENGYKGTEQEWLTSLIGQDGAAGAAGADGQSAYELAVENGYEGTIQDWLDGLTIEVIGAEGKSAYDLAVENGFNGSVIEWLASLKGEQGEAGKDGTVVTIGTNGNWFIDGVDSQVAAAGKDGSVVTINKDNNHWYIDGVDTGVVAVAQNGKDGTVVTIGTNGNWFIDGVDSQVAAAGKDGSVVTINKDNNHWYIDGVDTDRDQWQLVY